MYQDTIEVKNINFLENFLILKNEMPKNIIFTYFYDVNDNFEKLIIKIKNIIFLTEENIEILLNNFKNNNKNDKTLIKEYKTFVQKTISQKYQENDSDEIKILFKQI